MSFSKYICCKVCEWGWNLVPGGWRYLNKTMFIFYTANKYKIRRWRFDIYAVLVYKFWTTNTILLRPHRNLVRHDWLCRISIDRLARQTAEQSFISDLDQPLPKDRLRAIPIPVHSPKRQKTSWLPRSSQCPVQHWSFAQLRKQDCYCSFSYLTATFIWPWFQHMSVAPKTRLLLFFCPFNRYAHLNVVWTPCLLLRK